MNTIQDGACLLCGEEVEERFYSGSYETYRACECPHTVRYHELRAEISKFEELIRTRKNLKDCLRAAEQSNVWLSSAKQSLQEAIQKCVLDK